MSVKRKCVVLSTQQKLNVIKRSEKDESASKLADDFNIGVQTVQNFKNHENRLNDYVANNVSRLSKIKTMKRLV